MAELVSTGTGTIDVVASRLKAQAMQGMDGGLNPSAIQTNGLDFQGKPLPRGDVAKSIMAVNKAKFIAPDAPDWQQRKISAAPIKTTAGMHSPNKGEKVPNVLNRGTVAPSVVPAKRGNAKR